MKPEKSTISQPPEAGELQIKLSKELKHEEEALKKLVDNLKQEIERRSSELARIRRDLDNIISSTRQYAENIVNTVRDPLLVLNSNLKVISANQSFYSKFGVSPEETEGRLIYKMQGGQWDIPELRKLLESILPESKSFDDFEVNRIDGDRTMLLNARQVYRGDIGQQFILLAIEDITDRKRAETELKGSLAREQRMRGDLQHFINILSHDLRSPISSISNFSRLILSKYGEGLDDKAKDYLDYIKESTLRMEKLIRDLLLYGSVGARENPFAQVDSNNVLKAALSNLQSEIEERKALVVAKDCPVVKGDEVLLIQLFQNLIANSLAYTKQVPEIEISAQCMENEWLFSFRDNGIGIAPEDQERMFEPFERAQTTTSRGTGLGLSICRKIVEMHGGRIWVKSTLGEGATFYFTLPKA